MNSVEATRLSETAPIAVRTLDHVTVVVGDLEASRTFYVDVLGMLEVPLSLIHICRCRRAI